MAPKRQRTYGSSSRALDAFDTTRFISEAASNHYHYFLAGKTLIPERGLCPHQTQTNLATMIEGWSWGKFIEQPKPAVVSIVKEFYANAKQTEGRVVQVRGKVVSYDETNINAYYRLPGMVDDDKLMEYR